LPSPVDSVESHQPERPKGPLRPVLACDGHALLWLTCCCWTSRSDPEIRPVSPPQHPPLAPSSAHDTQAPSPLLSRMLSPPSAAPACQRAAPCFGARRAYLTLAHLSRVTSGWCPDSASAARSWPPGCPGVTARVGPSLKELDKITTLDNAMSSGLARLDVTLVPPHPLSASDKTPVVSGGWALCQVNRGVLIGKSLIMDSPGM
jgi:hypothetical protein